MRWIFTGMVATVLALAGNSVVQACGCCGCCRGGGASACPNGPSGGTCPNCPRHAAAYEPYRYWSSAYGCHLYYDPATRVSYYWSEPQGGYLPIQANPTANPLQPGMSEAPAPSSPSNHATQYYIPDLSRERNDQVGQAP